MFHAGSKICKTIFKEKRNDEEIFRSIGIACFN